MEMSSWVMDLQANFLDSDQMISPTERVGSVSTMSLKGWKEESTSRSRSPPQVMTPPDSLAGSPILDSSCSNSSTSNSTSSSNASGSPPASGSITSTSPETTFVSVSTTFYPGATIDSQPTDLILLSAESVFFYVHSARLLSVSENHFNELVSGDISKMRANANNPDLEPIISLPEPSTVLNILLHTVYGLSCTHYSPSLSDLSSAISILPKYGLFVSTYLAPSAPLASTLLTHARTSPLEVYTLAASLDLSHIAISTSPYLLSFPLSNLTDEHALRMGPVYLKRLFFLHLGRMDALKRLLLQPPRPHSPFPGCDYSEQKRVTRAWALASAYLMLDGRPDMSVSAVETTLGSLADEVGCEGCKAALVERVREVIMQWSVVKATI